MSVDRVIIEADGGSRGNPGLAAYGALVRDAATGVVIAERGETIGIATNNVAEYSGLIAGLELVAEHAPGAEVEVRMDSKLVVEQMAGRWKIKHADMRQLALQAQRLAPPGVTWTWVPRAQNKAADALANAAMDAEQGIAAPAPKEPDVERPRGWRGNLHGEPTTLVMLRHGVTDHTVRKIFCGSGGADPGLNDEGRAQAERAARWIVQNHHIDAIISSPLRRTLETAGPVSALLGLPVEQEPGIAELAFGEWDGLTFPEIVERFPGEVDAWFASPAARPPGGESLREIETRVARAHGRILGEFAGKTVLLVSHVTPIKLVARAALEAPLTAVFKMELDPASITTSQWRPDGGGSLRSFSQVP